MHSCSVIRTRVCFGISMKSQRKQTLRRKRTCRDKRTSGQKTPQRERSKTQHGGEADTKGGWPTSSVKIRVLHFFHREHRCIAFQKMGSRLGAEVLLKQVQ